VPLHSGDQRSGKMASDAVTARMNENSQILKQYTHLQKIEVYWKNKLRSTRFSEISYDPAAGKEISISLGSTSTDQSQPALGGREASSWPRS